MLVSMLPFVCLWSWKFFPSLSLLVFTRAAAQNESAFPVSCGVTHGAEERAHLCNNAPIVACLWWEKRSPVLVWDHDPFLNPHTPISPSVSSLFPHSVLIKHHPFWMGHYYCLCNWDGNTLRSPTQERKLSSILRREAAQSLNINSSPEIRIQD